MSDKPVAMYREKCADGSRCLHGCHTNEPCHTRQQPEAEKQEPVAWMTIDANGEEDDIWYDNPEGKLLEGWSCKPLYTHPQPKAEQDKPVAWFWFDERDGGEWIHIADNQIDANKFGDVKIIPLYTHPQPRKPLTDEAIATVYWGATGQSLRPQDNVLAHKFAKAIESAHDIKE